MNVEPGVGPKGDESLLIRPARKADQRTITAMVRSAGINPLSLHWPRFLVAEQKGRIVGVAQIKQHGEDARELASLAVVPDRQGEGIGSALVREWLSRERGALYLMCRDELEGYYKGFGFRRLGVSEMPAYFRRIMRLAGIFSVVARLLGERRHPIVMRIDARAAAPESNASRASLPAR